MLHKTFPTLIVGLFCLMGKGEAGAQLLDMNGLIGMEVNFHNQFYPWAWQQSVELARQIPDDQPLPFNAMTIYGANVAAGAAWSGYVNGLNYNSHRTSNAIGNWTNGAIRGYGHYADPHTGNTYQLPWQYNGYNVDNYGYASPGIRYDGFGTNVFPTYDW
jgi:hypothetical protein